MPMWSLSNQTLLEYYGESPGGEKSDCLGYAVVSGDYLHIVQEDEANRVQLNHKLGAIPELVPLIPKYKLSVIMFPSSLLNCLPR